MMASVTQATLGTMTDKVPTLDDRRGSPEAPRPGPLGERFPAQSGDTVQVVVRADDVASAEVRGDLHALLGELGRSPHVATVGDPYSTEGAIAPDGRTLGGRAVQLAETNQAGSEMIGLIAAAVILLIMFGSVVAAGLPLAMAIGGLAVSSSLVGVAAAVVDVPEFAPITGRSSWLAARSW
jgi:RND superfamily putative drug exporter